MFSLNVLLSPPPLFHSNEIVSYPLFFFFPFSIVWCPSCVALYNRDYLDFILSFLDFFNHSFILHPFPNDLPSFHLSAFPKDLPSFTLFLIWNFFPLLTLSCPYHMVHHYIINSILLHFSLLL